MIRIRRPSEASIERILGDDRAPFSYPDVGATARPADLDRLGRSHTIDRRTFSLAPGRASFENARAALLAWRHFDIPWLELRGAAEPVFVGQRVATVTRALGLWFVNPCRVVYVEADADSPDRVAFAYGTLPGHVALGEERFDLRHNRATGAVEFSILAFSRPALPITRLGYPYLRRVQKRFARAAAHALESACRDPSKPG